MDPASLIQLLDLTSLQGDDTEAGVKSLAKTACGNHLVPACAAVCVYPVFTTAVRKVISQVEGAKPKVATVAGGFPHGLSPLEARIMEITAVQDADEIDVVIRRDLANEGRWLELYDEIAQMRQASQSRLLKVILATGELKSPAIIFSASMCALMAGADFIKTSTGKEHINATIDAGFIMADAVRVFGETSGRTAGIKAAGGIRTYEEACQWHGLIYQTLGAESIKPSRFRIGASSLYEELAHLITS